MKQPSPFLDFTYTELCDMYREVCRCLDIGLWEDFLQYVKDANDPLYINLAKVVNPLLANIDIWDIMEFLEKTLSWYILDKIKKNEHV